MGSDEEVANDTPLQEQTTQIKKKKQKSMDSDFLTIGPIYPLDQFIVPLLWVMVGEDT